MKHRFFLIAFLFFLTSAQPLSVSAEEPNAADPAVEQQNTVDLDGGGSTTPGERDLTKTRDTYPATQKDIMTVSEMIRVGSSKGLLKLCEGKTDLDFSVQDGTLLRKAMFPGSPNSGLQNTNAERLIVAEFLLKNGCAPLLATDVGVACAATAVSSNNIDMFLLLQKYGFDVNRADSSGRNVTDYVLDAFDHATPQLDSALTTRIVSTPALDPFFNGKLPEANLALFRAVRRNDLEGVRKAIREKRGTEFINVPDKDRNTMLYYALRPEHPNPEIVRALLEAGAEMELVTSQWSYDSALMTLTRPSATSGSHTKLPKQMEIVPILWEYRDRCPEREWQNMFCVAAETGNADLFRFFMEHGLDPEKEAMMSRTPAKCAWERKTKEMVELLDEMGVRKPFWAAVKWNDMDLVKEYLRDGVDVNKERGLHYAVMANLPDMAELMIQNGANTEPEYYFNKIQAYPLSAAVAELPDGAAVVEILLKHGFKTEYPGNPANPNWAFDSALVHALWQHKYNTAKLLVKYGARTDLKVRVTYGWGETLTGFPKTTTGSLAERFRDNPDALDVIGYEQGIFGFIGDIVYDAAMFIMTPIRLYNCLLYGPSPIQ